MASVRNLKKDINFVLGDFLEAVYQWELETGNQNSKQSNKLIDKALLAFDELMQKVHQKEIKNPNKHFKAIRDDLEKKATELIEDLNKLSG